MKKNEISTKATTLLRSRLTNVVGKKVKNYDMT